MRKERVQLTLKPLQFKMIHHIYRSVLFTW